MRDADVQTPTAGAKDKEYESNSMKRSKLPFSRCAVTLLVKALLTIAVPFAGVGVTTSSLGQGVVTQQKSSPAPTATEAQFFRGGMFGSAGVSGGSVWFPNGKYVEYTEDLRIKLPGNRSLRWARDFNGNQWRFNPQWLSLEFEFDEIPPFLAGAESNGGGAPMVIPDPPPPEFIEVFGGTRIPGVDGSTGPAGRKGPLWAISRNGAWFLVDSTFCNFSIQNAGRYVLKPVFAGTSPLCATNRFAHQLGSQPNGGDGSPGVILADDAGKLPASVAGFRWEDRNGDWIEYDRSGRITTYGDRNNIKVTMQYSGGALTGVIDHTGRLVLTIGYDAGGNISEVRDVPPAGDTRPARVVSYTYGSKGSISSVTDVNGRVTQYGYDDKGRLITITDAELRVRRLEYGPTSRVTKLTQPDNSAIEYEYDYDKVKKQFLARARYPEVNGQRRIEVSLYNTDGQLISREVNGKTQRELSPDGRTDRITDGRGNVIEVTRNEFNQVVLSRYADGTSLTNTFDPKTLNLTSQRDGNGFTHRYEYDDAGNLRRRIMAGGTSDEQITEYTRDFRQRVRTATAKGRMELNGVVTPDATSTFEYDDQDNVTSVTDPEGKVSRYTYDRLGQVLTETDPRGGTWSYTYNAAGDLLTAQSPLGFITTYEYDKVGNQLKMTDGRGKVYRRAVDGLDRETRLIAPSGAEYVTEYNGMGAVASVTDASGKTMRFEYDAWTRPVKARDGKDFQYTMDYTEADGRDTGARQAAKVKYPTFERRLKYNERNRVTQKTDLDGTDGRTESYTYDGEGRRKTVTDAAGKTRTIDYNAFGQMTRIADSMGNAMRLVYDARGNVIEILDANGRKTKFEYDLRNLAIKETDPLGKSTRYSYDDNGWPKDTTLANGNKVEYTYDADARLITQKEYSGGALIKATSLTYDPEDNLVGWSDGSHSAALVYDDADRLASETINYGAFSKSRSYTYYPNNQVKTYTGPDEVTITYSYDALGQLERVSIPDEGDIAVTDWQWVARKKVLLPGGSEQRLEHDGLLMLTKLTVVNPGQATVFELENKYGRLQELTETKRDSVITTYGYDDAARLTSIQSSTEAFNEGYTVDASGSRVSDTRTGGATWQYDAANQLKQRGSVTYEYDDNGNLTKKTDSILSEPLRTTIYAYDSLNRLSEIHDGANALVARYKYDPFDRRLSKQLGESGPITYYVPSSTGLLAEVDAVGEVQVSYGWHPEHDDSTYPLFARVSDGVGGRRYVYYHNDHIGTPQRITDKAGKLIWSAQYDGFGKATVSTSAEGGVMNNLRYPGQYFDAETGLHYNDRRYYEPETGRYITRDPIGFAGGMNLYAYAAHSPTNLIDPTGEILPCLLINYLRCMASCMLISAVTDLALECGNINWGDNAKDCAVDCLLAMLPIPNPCGRFGQWFSTALGVAGAAGGLNSFTPQTLVHVKPVGGTNQDAQAGKAILKPIGELKPGDEVLAQSEWKERGTEAKADRRLSYEKVTDVFTSKREQRLVHITLESGENITATEGHPFKTTEGWRDAVILKKGGQLLLAAGDRSISAGDVRQADIERSIGIAEVRVETKIVQVFNLEVANAHTFFVGTSGAIAHNAKAPPSVNQMNQQINKGQAPSGVVRVDPSTTTVPGSQDHAHLDDGSAINRDGTTRHNNRKGQPPAPNNNQKKWLRKCGWKV
jgi:RHS repeat-associated protein